MPASESSARRDDRAVTATDPATDRTGPPLRVVLDARPLQAPSRNPTTATYLHELLGAFAARPDAGGAAATARGDSFLFLLDTPGPDPSPLYPGLPFAGRRRLPPTRRLRAANLTLDPFLLRAVSIGTTFDARLATRDVRGVLHVTGGTLPIASGLPMVVTLLDLAAWELPTVYQRSVAERFGQRLRVRLLRQADRLIVASEATARAASRFLPFPRERIHVVPLAATLPRLGGMAGERLAALRERLELPDRYLLFRAQYDARKDLPTLLRALRALASREGAGPSPASPAAAEADGEAAPLPWPPTVIACLPSAGPGDEAAEAHAADAASLRGLTERDGATTQFRVVPMLTRDDEAALVAGARALVHPALVEGSGLAAIDALSAGIPVVATNVGALGELVGKAGILVPPRDARRLAAAIETIWRDDRLQARLARAAAKRSAATTRTWADVARETREVYRLAAVRARA